jgi:mycothiol synthase
MDTPLPPSYQLRAATPVDAAEIVGLITACNLAQTGEADRYTEQEIIADMAGIDGPTRAYVVRAPDGTLAAYGTATNRGSGQLYADGYVHPNHRGHGLGTTLVRLTEREACAWVADAPEGARVALTNGIFLDDTAARAVLKGEGYALIRVHWQMRMTLASPPPTPAWPVGISVRTFRLDQDERATFDCVEEAFGDHWGHVPHDYEHWVKRVEQPEFDPSLWFLAVDGDQLAGVALCRQRPDSGWVGSLAVRRPWRRRGLGQALLQQVFATFYALGQPNVGLGVDSQNLTGATRLYERVGMHVSMRAAIFEKELRHGTDLRTQTLTD